MCSPHTSPLLDVRSNGAIPLLCLGEVEEEVVVVEVVVVQLMTEHRCGATNSHQLQLDLQVG